MITDEYNGPNSFVPAGSFTTGIPSVVFPDLSSGIIDIPNTILTNSLLPGKFRRGFIESFNFTVQREIGAGFVLQAAYVGTRSIRQALTYFEANAGIVPGAGAAGRPAEALNLTNTPTLSNPNGNVSTPSNFMAITRTISTATTPQRTMRFGLRFAF